MLKFLSEINGSQIALFQERALVGKVTDYLVEPETGKLLGVYTIHPLDKKPKIIPAREIKALSADFILIEELESLTEPEEIVKVQKAESTNPKLIGEKVVTEAGQIVGKVHDAVFNLETFNLEKIYVTPKAGVKSLTKELIISAARITKIEKKIITIKDDTEKVSRRIFVPKPVPSSN